MQIQEIQMAIEHLDNILSDDDRWNGCEKCKEGHIQLREWLIELHEYRQIGTVDEYRNASQKQMPKKAVKDEKQYMRYATVYRCPSCGGRFTGMISQYCYHCGQALDWENE